MGVRRPAAVAGMFYPGEPESLRSAVEQLYLRAPKLDVRGEVLGIIVPHAGYVYSGPTAAAGYAAVLGRRFDTVVIVAPSHREYFRGISIYPGDAYVTPLGEVPVDTELRERMLNSSSLLVADVAGHRDEHAIEVQLPFLQVGIPAFRLLPVVMGEQGRSYVTELGRVLVESIRGGNTLLIASTDLSHYHSSRVAEAVEKVLVEDLLRMDDEALMSDLEGGTTEACGGGPMVAVLQAMKGIGATRVEIIRHTNSGEITGEKKSVVGYLSAVGLS